MKNDTNNAGQTVPLDSMAGGLCETCEHNDDLIYPPEERDGGACFIGHGVCTPPAKYCPDYKPANDDPIEREGHPQPQEK